MFLLLCATVIFWEKVCFIFTDKNIVIFCRESMTKIFNVLGHQTQIKVKPGYKDPDLHKTDAHPQQCFKNFFKGKDFLFRNKNAHQTKQFFNKKYSIKI